MSSNDRDDYLGELLHPTARRSQGEKPSPSDAPKGLNPLDLLGLPQQHRDLINWLSRRKQASFDEIKQALDTNTDQVTQILSTLKQAGHINEALIEGNIFYRVVFGGKISRGARGLPEGLWERVDLDSAVFLKQVSLFQNLPEADLRALSTRLTARKYRRNEVILWQGGLGEGIYFIKSGMVGITRLSPDKRHTQILNYLKQGDLFGEYGLLIEKNAVASATVTALSEVEVLLMKREDALEMLHKYPGVAIELVQLLAHRLQQTALSGQFNQETTLCLVFGVTPRTGCTTIGNALAMTVAQATHNATVYTEHPLPHRMADQIGFGPDVETYRHAGAYDIWVPHHVAGMPATVRITLLMDRLMSRYANIIMGVTGEIDETILYLLQKANQIVLVTLPDKESWQRLKMLKTHLRSIVDPDRTRLTVVCNRPDARYETGLLPEYADIDIPYLRDLPALARQTHRNLPESMLDVVTLLAERLGRTNELGIYLPAVMQGQEDQPIDTRQTVEKAIDYFKLIFGNATLDPMPAFADDTADSPKTENVHVVHTFATKATMERYLGDVLEFVAQIKTNLGQEAIAVEVNKKLMLI